MSRHDVIGSLAPPPTTFNERGFMSPIIRLSAAAALVLAVAACATAPPPPPDYPPPGQRQLDAKTQLETGRRY